MKPTSFGRSTLLLEQIRMGARTHEDHNFDLRAVVDLVGQQEVAADVTFSVPGPITFQRMIEPFGAKWCIVGDEEQHRLFEAMHVVSA